MSEVYFPHDPESCNCDRCRYWRWEMTLKVERIEIVAEPITEAFNQRAAESADFHFKRFLQRETAGDIVAPSGPFTEENGWKRELRDGMELVGWGGGALPIRKGV